MMEHNLTNATDEELELHFFIVSASSFIQSRSYDMGNGKRGYFRDDDRLLCERIQRIVTKKINEMADVMVENIKGNVGKPKETEAHAKQD
jgi:hypothetical protein